MSRASSQIVLMGLTARSALPSCTISRGPIRPVETLLTMRSRSPTWLSASCSVSLASGCLKRYSTTVCRLRIGRTSLSGKAIQRCNRRPPIGVIVRSMISYSVRLSSSIRLRCWIWPVCRCCVISRYINIPPAAVTPAGIFSKPKPFSEETPHNFCSRSRAVDSTSIQSSSSKVKNFEPKRFSSSALRPRRCSTSLGAKFVSSLSI